MPVYIIPPSSSSAVTTKVVKNNTAITLPQFSIVAWVIDGSVTLASASSISGMADFAGIVQDAIPAGESGIIVQEGAVEGMLAISGAMPGQEIFLSEVAGQFVFTASTAYTDTILRIGIAEPASGSLTGIATDLRIALAIISQP